MWINKLIIIFTVNMLSLIQIYLQYVGEYAHIMTLTILEVIIK